MQRGCNYRCRVDALGGIAYPERMNTKLMAAVAVLLLAGPFSWAQSPYWTGDGGKGKSITILPPRGVGLAANQAYLPDFVANELLSNFSTFSAMTPFDRVNNQRQYDELLSGYYADDDKAALDLGHLASTDYMLLGTITKTSTGYALQLTINSNRDKTTAAAYSAAVSVADLDNLTGVRKASLDLLGKMGVQLTAQARTELTSAATAGRVTAQTAMAQGMVVQRQGTEVEALSYFFQAAAFDPSLLEAANMGSVMNASIISGNMSDNARSDIQWRRDWVARLTSTETYFDNFFKTSSLPYTLFYSTAIKQGTINYQTETVTLSIEVNLHASRIWASSVERALQAVYQGLDATGRKGDWGLAKWPGTGVTSLKPFNNGNKTFAITAELVNERNKVIGRQNFNVKGDWRWNGTVTAMNISNDDMQSVTFTVKADDITDKLTIRIAGVNGVDAQTAARNNVLQTRALSGDEWSLYQRLTLNNGVLTRANIEGTDLNIPATIWGEPVSVIEERVFGNRGLTSVIIPDSVTHIGNEAFRGNQLYSVFIPDSVTSIGRYAFANSQLATITIGHSVTSIGEQAFAHNQLTRIVIPSSVTTVGEQAFANNRLHDIFIHSGVTHIGNGAFANNQLTSVYIPNSVTYIGDKAFEGNQLTKVSIVSIPNSVIHIGNEAFQGSNSFARFYDKNGKKAGTYTYESKKSWSYSAR